MSVRRLRQKRQRAFRPAIDGLEERQLLSSAHGPELQAAKGGGGAPSSPALVGFNDTLYEALVGSSPARITIAASTDGGKRFSSSELLPETSSYAPALAAFDGRLSIAWTGPGHHINLESSSDGVNWGDKFTLPETSDAGPALTTFDGRLYVAWAGTDPDHHINVASSADAVDFDPAVTRPETSDAGPALAGSSSGGGLAIAWTGTDEHHRINIETASDGVTFGNKVTLAETTPANKGSKSKISPALASFHGFFYVAWKGTDNRLNSERSIDGVNFEGKVTYSATSTDDTGPALGSLPGSLFIGWLGRGPSGLYTAQRIASA